MHRLALTTQKPVDYEQSLLTPNLKKKRGYWTSEKPVNSHSKNPMHAQSGTAMPFTQAVYPSAASKDSHVRHEKKALGTNISSEVEKG